MQRWQLLHYTLLAPTTAILKYPWFLFIYSEADKSCIGKSYRKKDPTRMYGSTVAGQAPECHKQNASLNMDLPSIYFHFIMCKLWYHTELWNYPRNKLVKLMKFFESSYLFHRTLRNQDSPDPSICPRSFGNWQFLLLEDTRSRETTTTSLCICKSAKR